MGDWTFFSNYGHVLVCLARNNRARLRDVAQDVGITERAVQKIVKDLQEAGYITVRKQGRCNRYRINRRKALRHGLESHVTVSRLLALVSPPGRAAPGAALETQEVDEVPVLPKTETETVAVPETVEEPAAESIAEPAAKVKPEAAQVPEPEPEPEPHREPAPEPNLAAELQGREEKVSKPASKSDAKKRKKEKGPIDIEQQGSLF